MPYNIGKAQQKLLSTDWLQQNADQKAQYEVIDDVLDYYVAEFLKNLNKYYNSMGVAASGQLISKAKVVEYENGRTIELPIYYDYVNKGVKGWGDSSNAPDSPYQYKTKGMNAQGRASIKKYLSSAKGKSRLIDKPYKSTERKYKKITPKGKLEAAVDRAVWNIKKYGIKKNPYFDMAYKETFNDLEVVVSEVLGKTVEIMVQKTFEGKKQ